ncbi:MAG TPA: hypothetical protein VKM55_08585 [Candidatus Lokiarchaeia archaeon]|nr:hypothetical protein [Candidatus Lokiarchaeia archaeon]
MDDGKDDIGFTYNAKGDYGLLLAPCNCCGGFLHVNVTRHGYITLDCENFGSVNKAPCEHARYIGKHPSDWTWKCMCSKKNLDRACPNRKKDAIVARKKIQDRIETVIYMTAMSRHFTCLDLRESDYVDFEPAVMDAVNMTFTIDGKGDQRPYIVFVRRYYRHGDNISSRFFFFKKGIIINGIKILLSLMSKLARIFKKLDWITNRYEIL